MFDGLMKSKFFNKCKSDIKLIRARIEIIKRKRNATQKYLRNDIADLLRNGFDVEAFGRGKGLILEMVRSQCYELIDQYCEHILKNLNAMNKQSECPEDCREAASGLMFAAARFADLPELRDLRSVFSEKYGNSLDYYVNKQFSEKLKSDPPSNDAKLQLLQEIAQECGLDWDSEALENKLFKEAAYDKKVVKEAKDSAHPSDPTEDEFPKARECTPERKPSSYYGDRLPKNRDEPLKPRAIPPAPYTKPQVNKENRSSSEESEEDDGGDNKREMNKENVAESRRVLRFLDGGGDEEESMLDKLLRHYSRKKSDSSKGKNMGRASSLGVESRGDSPMKHSRAASFHPGTRNHVHPKLPDYDEFVARLAAFRGGKS